MSRLGIDRQKLHSLFEEFREVLDQKDYGLPKKTDGILILSVLPLSAVEENFSRIKFGARVLREIISKISKKKVEEIKEEDLKTNAVPLFVLNGVTEQLSDMDAMAQEVGIPAEKRYLLSCGTLQTSNTKTQFQAVPRDPLISSANHLTIITNSYHVPRVKRAACKNLPPTMRFTVIGVPFSEFPFDLLRIRGEIKRIITYSRKGDISEEPVRR